MQLSNLRRHGSTLFAGLIVLGAGAIYFAGIGIHVVESPSMRPSVPTNAVVAVRPVRVEDVKSGDIVSFADPQRPGRTILHRVESFIDTNRGRVLRTKGDANPAADAFAVSDQELHGVAVAVVPRGGQAVRLLVNQRAPYVLVGVPLALWLAAVITDVVRKRTRLEKGFAQ